MDSPEKTCCIPNSILPAMPTIPRFLHSVLLLALSSAFGLAAPLITSIDPSTGPTSGGTTITINGSGFGTNAAFTFVSLGGSPMPITGFTDTRILATTPAGEGAGKLLTVTFAGQTSNAATFSYLPPAITSFTPATVPTAGGTSLTLVGSNFGLNPIVTSGPTNFPVTSRTHSSIICTVPAGQGSSIPVTVTTAGQTSNSVSVSYTPPAITAITPTTGPTAGNTSITIIGSNFGVSPNVSIGGKNAPVTSGTHTQLVVNSPVGEGVNQPVVVNSGGQISNSAQFSYLPPAITGITPASGPTAGGSLITLTGSNFGTGPVVLFNGASISPNTSSHSQLIFALPAGEGANLPVRVSSGGQVSPATNFSYGAPVLTGISAASFPTAGSTPLTLTGSNFGLNPQVRVGTQAAPLVAGASSHSQIVCTLPVGEGTGNAVAVTVAGVESNTLPLDYDPPEILTISPAAGTTGGGTLITLTGRNFGSGGSVTIGGQLVFFTAGTSYSHTRIVAATPAGQGAGRPVVVETLGRSSNAVNFDYDAPQITHITCNSAPTAGGTILTLTGSNFGLSGSVSVGGHNAPVTSGGYSHTVITCTLPPGQGIDLPVVVSSGQRSSNTLPFSYDAPVLDAITPASGPTAGGTRLTLTGSNFGVSPSVSLGGRNVPLAVAATHTMLQVDLPAGEGADQAVVVTAGEQTSPAVFFNYAAPSITSISPGNGPTAGNIPITIHGQNFGLSPVVSIGGKSAPVVAISHTSITCTLPAGSGRHQPVVVTTAGQVSNTSLFDYDGDTFSSWSDSIAWNGLDSSPGADPRHSGWKNCLAYALGVDPTTANGGEIASRNPPVHGMPAISRGPTGALRISFWRRRASASPDLIYQVLFADHPASVSWDGPAADPQVEVVDDTWEFCTFTDAAAGGSKRFGRLKVELATPP